MLYSIDYFSWNDLKHPRDRGIGGAGGNEEGGRGRKCEEKEWSGRKSEEWGVRNEKWGVRGKWRRKWEWGVSVSQSIINIDYNVSIKHKT